MQIVGAGEMGIALAEGISSAGHDVTLVCKDDANAVQVSQTVSSEIKVATAIPAVPDQDIFVAVKPADVYGVLATLKHRCRIVSIAAGVTIRSIEDNVPAGSTVIRAMPNLPVVVGAGVTALAASQGAEAHDIAWAIDIFETVGEVVLLEEGQLDLVTGVSGSGPGYFYRIVAGLEKAAVEQGLTAEQARKLVGATFIGAAKQYLDQDASAAELIRSVTTPGGTTEAGLNQLELAGIDAILSRVVRSASERSGELGNAQQ